MRVLYVIPLMNPIIMDIESTLQAKQKLVGGPIEVLRFTHENDAVIVLNEVGRILGMPVNRTVAGHSICGPFIVCGYDCDGNLLGLTDTQLSIYIEFFSLPATGTQLN